VTTYTPLPMAKGKATMKGNTKATKAPPKKSARGPSKKKTPQKGSALHHNNKNKGSQRRAFDDASSKNILVMSQILGHERNSMERRKA
jgi:hypothetical protein